MFRRILRRGSRQDKPDVVWITEDIAVWRAPEEHEWGVLAAIGIGSVLDLRAETPDRSELVIPHGLTYRRVGIEEGEAVPPLMLQELAFWVVAEVQARKSVLIHCREGRGRSPMVACAALVQLGHPLPRAFDIVRRAQPLLSLSNSQIEALEKLTELPRASDGDSAREP